MKSNNIRTDEDQATVNLGMQYYVDGMKTELWAHVCASVVVR
jgi:hypothetical protein